MVKAIKQACVFCRTQQGRPVQQLMADLTEARTSDGHPLFTQTSVDYCGPFTVAQARGREKKV